jgi:hypothetical protein
MLLVAVVAAVLLSRTGKGSNLPPSPESATAQTRALDSTKPQTVAGLPAPPTTIAAVPAPTEAQAPKLPAKEPGRTTTVGERLASTDHSVATRKQQTKARRKNAGNASSRPQPTQPTGIFANNAFDSARTPKKPRQLEYSAEKIIAKAQTYRGEVIIPGGMYSLTRARADHQSGNRKCLVTECALKEQGPQKKLHMTSLWSTVMEVEPGLASNLDKDWGALEGRVAILTLWITNSGEAGIVAAEILQKFTPRLKPGYGPGQADIDYEVLFVSPNGSKPGKADDADWQKVGRLNHLYLHHKHLVQAYRQRLQSADMARLTTQMNGLYADMLKGMAAEAATQRSLQRSISGR